MNDSIRQSIVGLAEKSPTVSYEDLHAALGTKTDLELETLLIEAIYEGTVEGKFDPAQQMFEILDWKATIPTAEQQEFIGGVLGKWFDHCETLMSDLNAIATGSKEAAKQTQEEDEAHEKEVEEQREALQASGKLFTADSESGRIYPMARDHKRMKNLMGPSNRTRRH